MMPVASHRIPFNLVKNPSDPTILGPWIKRCLPLFSISIFPGKELVRVSHFWTDKCGYNIIAIIAILVPSGKQT